MRTKSFVRDSRKAVLWVVLGFLLFNGPERSIMVFRADTPDAYAEEQKHEGHEGHAAHKVQATPVQSVQNLPVVDIPPNKQKLIGVAVAEVSMRSLEKLIRTVGRIDYNERAYVTVNTKFEGWIEKLYVDYTGRYVKKGEPMAEIYSPELLATQMEFINSLGWARKGGEKPEDPRLGAMLSKDAGTVIEGARQRLKLWDITDQEIQRIEETGKPKKRLTIFSPVSGYVVEKMALQGMKVMPGEKLFDVADLSTLWVFAEIYEYELPLIRLGQTAKITLSYLPDREFISRIDYIYPSISTTSRTARVRFEIPDPQGSLKPQMFTNVEITIDLGNRLSIPEDAVIDTGMRQVVYLDKGGGSFEPREVMLGVKAQGFREVLMGLEAGEKVASSGVFLIDSEAQLRGVTPMVGHQH